MGEANEAYESLISRRSIRSFTSQKVSAELLHKLLNAAMSAPSAHHEEPWHFIVMDDRAQLDRIMAVHPYAKMLATAPLAILVCGDFRLEKSQGYSPVDCGNATMNILHAAHALGLGGVWVGVYPKQERMDEMRRLITIPDNVFPFALIPIGYPAETKGKENRYKEERVHHNKW
jgi:nitroreductase